MTRLYGRASKGVRVAGTIPQHYGDNITLLGALGQHGIQAVRTVNGATDADVFGTHVKQALGPTRVPGDIVVLDNLSAHKRWACSRYWPAAGYGSSICRLTRPTSRPWNCVSKLKTALRAAKAHPREALETAIRAAMDTVTGLDAYNWFRHCGYAL